MPTFIALLGPLHETEPRVAVIGESYKYELTLYDGAKVEGLPYGAAVDISAGTKKLILTVFKPDGSANYTRDSAVLGEGEKLDDGSEALRGRVNFYIPHTDTANWLRGTYPFKIEYRDTAPTVEDRKSVVHGTFRADAGPEAND